MTFGHRSQVTHKPEVKKDACQLPCTAAKQQRRCELLVEVFTLYLQLSETSPAHRGGDGLDGGEQGVEEEGQAAGSPLHLPLLVQHEPRQRHGVGVHRGLLGKGCCGLGHVSKLL